MGLWQELERRWADPGRLALTGDVPDTSFASLRDRALRTAAWLDAEGVRPGDVVAIALGKERAALELVLACAATGAVALPLHPRATEAERAFLVGDAEARLVVGAAPPLDRPPREAVDVDPDAPAALLYTSGTTGRPKGALLSHHNLLATITALHAAWGWTAGDVLLHALPLFHVHGLVVAQLGALYAGATAIWHDGFDAARALADLPRATVFMGVPTFYHRLLGLDLEAADLSRVRLFTSGSAALPAADHAAFRARTGHAILERYGMTEIGIALSNPLHGERRPGRVGAPLPGVAARIVDEGGADVADGGVGELWIRGPGVFSGYLRRPEATAAALVDGWMRTGDLASRDADGSVAIVGRRSELVISGGFNVYPLEVEAALAEHPAVAEVAVYGVADADLGERVVAAAVLREPVGAEALRTWARGRLSGYKVPREVRILPALPRNALGKVQKAALRAAHAPLTVRPAVAADAAWLAEGNAAMALETEGLRLDPDTVRRGVARVFSGGTGARYLVAERGGEAVGQLMITTEWSDWRDAPVWWIQSVYVWPNARGAGVYRALYARVVEEARAAGVAGIRLYVDERNQAAQAVYARLGMEGGHYRTFEAMLAAGPGQGGAAGAHGR